AFAVRPTVLELRAHPSQLRLAHRPPVEVPQACDPAHRLRVYSGERGARDHDQTHHSGHRHSRGRQGSARQRVRFRVRDPQLAGRRLLRAGGRRRAALDPPPTAGRRGHYARRAGVRVRRGPPSLPARPSTPPYEARFARTRGSAGGGLRAAWRRFRSLSPTDRRLVTEAAALLCVARAGLWLLPLRTLRRALDWYGRRDPAPTPVPVVLPAKVAWAIAALSRRLPGPMTCLVQALAADTLLRRYGYAPDLR